jgi:AcrR family transcriptional regulator
MSLSFENRMRAKPNRAKGEETAARILEATGMLLETQGYDALNTNRIAQAAGINIATLYKYYPNKQSILIAMTKRNRGDWLEAVGQSVASVGAGADWRATLEAIMDFAAQRRINQPGGKAMRLAMRISPELQPFDREETEVTASFLSKLLVERGGLERTYADQVARVAVEIATSILDLSLFDQSPGDEVFLAEAKAAICRYLEPHLSPNRPPLAAASGSPIHP